MQSKNQIKLFNSTIVKHWLLSNPARLNTNYINDWLITNKYKHRFGGYLGSDEPNEYIKNGRRYRFRQNEADLWYEQRENLIVDLTINRNYGDYVEEKAVEFFKLLEHYSAPCPFKLNEWTVDISDSDFDRWANSTQVIITANQLVTAINSKGYLYEMTLLKNKDLPILECFI